MFVYIITNKVNGKQYVGQHSGNDLQKYWNRNVTLALGNRDSKPFLFKAIRKYGSDNFSCLPLVLADNKSEMDFYEQVMISVFNTKAPSGYNLTDGGGGTLGRVVSEETKLKMSLSQVGKEKTKRGYRRSEEFKIMMSGNTHALGYKHTEEAKEKISLAHRGNDYAKGHKRSEETKRKISEAGKGRRHSFESIEKMRLAQQNRSEDTLRKMSESAKNRRK